MDLEEVDVLEIEALERRVDSIEDGLARQASLVRVVLELGQLFRVQDASEAWVFADDAEAFREDDELVAGEVVFLDGFADDLF